jgi:hypothetical protein
MHSLDYRSSTNAVALLGLLLLINLLRVGTHPTKHSLNWHNDLIHFSFIRQDILQQTTTSSGRKRTVSDDPFGQWMTNLGQGGIRTIPYEVMASVLPLLVSSTSSLSLSSV